MGRSFRAAVVTVSDGVTAGTRRDESGDAVEELLRGAGYEIAGRSTVPDERPEIEALLQSLAHEGMHLVVTTGGTGFGPRDVTPEATRAVIDREAPGLAELMRRAGLEKTAMAALSRGVAGSRGGTLILNLPGSPTGVRESLEAVLPVVPHALELLTGEIGAHSTGHAGEGRGRGDEPDERVIHQWLTRHAMHEWVDVRAVKVTGSPPCRVGNRMRIVPGGQAGGTLGCAEFDERAVVDAAEVYASGEPQTRTYRHEHGEVEVYFEPHVQGPILVVVSATDVARELRPLAHRLGFRTVMVESRGERIVPADRNLPGGVVGSIGELELSDRDHVVFTDHDAPDVAEQLASVLRSPARFVGVMGSRRHVGPYIEELLARGFTDEDLARIRSPVGVDLGGQRPEEIALSIAAGLVAALHDRDAGWMDRR